MEESLRIPGMAQVAPDGDVVHRPLTLEPHDIVDTSWMASRGIAQVIPGMAQVAPDGDVVALGTCPA